MRRATMKLTIEEIPDPRAHHGPCIVCSERPRYLAVISDGRDGVRGAFTLCNACANDEGVLELLEEDAESFW